AEIIACGEDRHSARPVRGCKGPSTGNRQRKRQGFIRKHLDSQTGWAAVAVLEVWLCFAAGETVRTQPKRIHNVRAKQVRATEGECLRKSVIARSDTQQAFV